MEQSEQSQRIASLLGELEAAGASVIEVKGEPEARAEMVRNSKLTDATLQGFYKSGIDFTAWVAWTLRF